MLLPITLAFRSKHRIRGTAISLASQSMHWKLSVGPEMPNVAECFCGGEHRRGSDKRRPGWRGSLLLTLTTNKQEDSLVLLVSQQAASTWHWM